MSTITVITGGSRGLGRSAALNLAGLGNDVVITYQTRESEAQKVVSEIQAMGRKAVALQLDVADSTTFPAFAERLVEALRATWGRETFDNLVNNAGHGDYNLILDTTEEQFDKLVNVHFKGVFFLTKTLLPLMADGGRIVNLSTGLTRVSAPGLVRLCGGQGSRRDPIGLHGEGTGIARNRSQRSRTRSNRNRLLWWRSSRYAGLQQVLRGHDCSRPRRTDGRYRPHDRQAA